MNSKIKLILGLVLLVVLIVVASLAYQSLSVEYVAPPQLTEPTPASSSSQTEAATQAGESSEDAGPPVVAAPDFSVVDMDGNAVMLSDYKGTPVVLNFWASWCPPCKMEMPHFDSVAGEYASDELVFLMVDMVDGSQETTETGKAFIAEEGYTNFTVLFDTEQEAAIAYGVRSLPSTVFINKDGNIATAIKGFATEEVLRQGIALITSAE